MLEKTQFLHILAAESQHLITVTIFLPNDVKQNFQNQLNEAFASDSFSDTAKAWNEERARVVQEAVEKHLLPIGVKWTREYVREAVEESMASHCANVLYNVCPPAILLQSSSHINVVLSAYSRIAISSPRAAERRNAECL